MCIEEIAYGIIAAEGFESVEKSEGRWVPDPLKGLPVGNYPHVVHGDYGVQEGYEALFVMGLGEPSGVVEKTKGCSAKKNINKFIIFKK